MKCDKYWFERKLRPIYISPFESKDLTSWKTIKKLKMLSLIFPKLSENKAYFRKSDTPISADYTNISAAADYTN